MPRITFKNLTGDRDERWQGNGFGSGRATHGVFLDEEQVGVVRPTVGGWRAVVREVDLGRRNTFAAAKQAARAALEAK